jgi:TRAP-type C4-dicarboxylate transport system permease small subunit
MTRAITALSLGWAVLGGVVLLAIVSVTAVNVGAFALDRAARLWGGEVGGLPGYEDFVRLAVGAAVPMFLPYCQARRGHLAVDLFLKNGPPALRRGIDRLSLLLMAALAVFLAYWMVLGLLETRDDGALSRVLGWPEWPFYITGIVSLALWALVSLTQVFDPPQDRPVHG